MQCIYLRVCALALNLLHAHQFYSLPSGHFLPRTAPQPHSPAHMQQRGCGLEEHFNSHAKQRQLVGVEPQSAACQAHHVVQQEGSAAAPAEEQQAAGRRSVGWRLEGFTDDGGALWLRQRAVRLGCSCYVSLIMP